jgi:hypothetical protein
MPNLNPSLPGIYAHGVAGDGGVVAVNGQTIAGPNAGGNPDMHGPDWFSATEVLCKTYPPERLVAVDWQTGAQTVLYEGPVSDFCGGGGYWAALCLDGVVRIGDHTGVVSEDRDVFAPIAFGPDGTFASKRWHRDGLMLDGVELVPSHIRVEDVQVFAMDRALYRIGRTVHGYGLPGFNNLTLGFDFGWVRGVQIGARMLLACQYYGWGVVAFYADDPTRGWSLGTDPCYRLDISLLGGGRARAVWSRVSRDHAEDIVVKDWSLAEPMVTFDSEAQPQPPLQSPDPEPPVSIPNRFDIVSDINAKHPELLQQNTHDTIREFYHRVAWALHLSDPRWGMLGKEGGGQHQVIEGAGKVAEDAIAYRDAVPVVDIIANANGNGPAGAAWQVTELRRDSDKWVKPPRFVEPDNPTPPKPETPKPQPTEDWGAKIAALSQRVEAAEQSAVAAQSAALIAVAKAEAIERTLERQVDALEARVKRLRLISDKDGEPYNSGSTWSHAHTTKFRLVLPD